MPSAWQSLVALDATRWRLLVEAQLTLLLRQVLHLVTPRGRLLRAGPHVTRTPAAAELERARVIGWAVACAARRGVIRPKCLVRALALQRMLHRHGLTDAQCRIGVRRADGHFEAHAWVELDGRVIGDDEAWVARFTPTTEDGIFAR